MVKQTGPMKDSQPAFSRDHLSRPMTARKLEQCNTRNRTLTSTMCLSYAAVSGDKILWLLLRGFSTSALQGYPESRSIHACVYFLLY
ncbi:hypothetical protein T4E_1384 [Trichinella pseudospiralis]|uniref:Uncharacterized protein n=1 Tax=Trichinella pseudospiralis TaxID=6337 RepID=A0A0V0YNE1_TRIPS|nr:hypothetical protein T4E_1384 [Trichinella pseudospiralis]